MCETHPLLTGSLLNYFSKPGSDILENIRKQQTDSRDRPLRPREKYLSIILFFLLFSLGTSG